MAALNHRARPRGVAQATPGGPGPPWHTRPMHDDDDAPAPRVEEIAPPFEGGAHLRAMAAALPAACGVYVFHGEGDEDALPLYIGKSVNLRSRVQAHLRNPEEARMLQMARRISHQRTAGELGALLLEAQLVKRRQPLFNRKLRRTRQLCAIRLREGEAPQVVHTGDVDFAADPHLHGLFPSRRDAVERLHDLADAHRLCLGLLGLERLAGARGCFRAALRRCAGACRGDEPRAAHDARLRAALDAMRLRVWPHAGTIGLIERDPAEGRTDIHVVRDWCHLGTVADLAAARRLARVPTVYDGDLYRLLCGPVLEARLPWVAIDGP